LAIEKLGFMSKLRRVDASSQQCIGKSQGGISELVQQQHGSNGWGWTRSNELFINFNITILKSITTGLDQQQIPCPSPMQNVSGKLRQPTLQH
jgi:hypothetical protein